jgi:hypothetical protein
MRIYIYCPITEGYPNGRGALRFLHSWGIEPASREDEHGPYLAFRIPRSWPRKKRLRFKEKLRQRIRRRVLLACCCCGSTDAIDLVECDGCGNRVATCGECQREGCVLACPICEPEIPGT